MMNAAQYLDKVQQGIPGAMDNGARVDWMDEILQTPFNQTYSINLKVISKHQLHSQLRLYLE